jgi:hypothetical protein
MRNPANRGSSGRARDKSRSKNALTHGIYGKDILYPWESREEFEKLLAELRDEFQPSGRMENEIVFDLAHSRWQKYRLHQMWIAAAYGDPFVSDLVKSGQKSWVGILNHLKCESKNRRMISDLENALFSGKIEEDAKTLVELIQTGKLADSATKSSETKKREFNASRTVMKDFTIPLIEAYKDRPDAEDSLRRTYSPEYLEPIIRLEAMIDARIDKALGRLISLKEYKRVAATYNPPLISADPSSTPSDVKDIAAVETITNSNHRE